MSELQNRLDRLTLRLDRMGMRVEQAVLDALDAVANRQVEAGLEIDSQDRVIDREEVEIEQECIRLLALYQPAAIDLRTICTIIKVNSDLERIADLAAGIGRRVKHVAEGKLDMFAHEGFRALVDDTRETLSLTVRILATTDREIAGRVIRLDERIDEDYRAFVRRVLDSESNRAGGAETAMTMINLAKAMERIGDHCTNIAEDVIFLRTGDVVRHPEAFGTPK